MALHAAARPVLWCCCSAVKGGASSTRAPCDALLAAGTTRNQGTRLDMDPGRAHASVTRFAARVVASSGTWAAPRRHRWIARADVARGLHVEYAVGNGNPEQIELPRSSA